MVKIDASKLGIREPIEIEETNATMRKVLKAQFTAAKSWDVNDDDSNADLIKKRLDALDAEEEFIADILRLNKSQQAKLDNLTREDTEALATQIIIKIQHIEESDEDATDDSKDPKVD